MARFPSWENGPQGSPTVDRSFYEPTEIETLRILDLDGTIIIINTRLKPEHQDPNAVAGLAAVLNSIRIEQA